MSNLLANPAAAAASTSPIGVQGADQLLSSSPSAQNCGKRGRLEDANDEKSCEPDGSEYNFDDHKGEDADNGEDEEGAGSRRISRSKRTRKDVAARYRAASITDLSTEEGSECLSSDVENEDGDGAGIETKEKAAELWKELNQQKEETRKVKKKVEGLEQQIKEMKQIMHTQTEYVNGLAEERKRIADSCGRDHAPNIAKKRHTTMTEVQNQRSAAAHEKTQVRGVEMGVQGAEKESRTNAVNERSDGNDVHHGTHYDSSVTRSRNREASNQMQSSGNRTLQNQMVAAFHVSAIYPSFMCNTAPS